MEGGHIVEISDEDEIFTNPKDERTQPFPAEVPMKTRPPGFFCSFR